jgi:voltage-dependent potassium channel beta subunit
MKYRHLGHSGLEVSELSFGSWVSFHNQLDRDEALDCMKTAYDAGINFFDNAEAYAAGKSEEMMGSIFKRMGWRRSSYVVSTKFFWGLFNNPNEQNTLNRKRLMDGIDGSLKRFQLDYVDLIFCHRPDVNTPIEETVWAMHDIIGQGKALYWGTSEWSADQILQAWYIADRHHLRKPVMEQPQYHMLHRERVEKEYARLYKEIGLGTTIWSPLAGGLLSGKYNNGIPAESRATLKGYEWMKDSVTDANRLDIVRKLKTVADSLGCSQSQLALAWCLKNKNVSTVILGASNTAQLKENLKAQDVVAQLTPDVMERIEEILKNKPEGGEE